MSDSGQRRRKRFNPDRDVEEWHGAYVPYDLLKEALVALLVVGVLIVGFAVIFSSPDEHPVTLKTWTASDPVDFARPRSPNSMAPVAWRPTGLRTTQRREVRSPLVHSHRNRGLVCISRSIPHRTLSSVH